jgi:AraC-like DNA-binding protein
MRRRVDWPIILRSLGSPLGSPLPAPRVVARSEPGRVASLLSAIDEVLALDDPDAILRRAAELARTRIGLARVGVFLLDRSRDLMLGTWGSDLDGRIIDEHDIMYAVTATDREAVRRARERGAHFTVFDDCPIVEHRKGQTQVSGRGWVACTPILSVRATISMMYNDAGLSGAAVDDVKQAHAAILCSLLGAILDPVRGLIGPAVARASERPQRRLMASAVALIEKDPAISARHMAQRLQITPARLARVFKTEMGMSLVAYRNRMRLDHFDRLLDRGGSNLLEAALAAGFGSYAQFHRVFRAVHGIAPRTYWQRRT